MPTTCATPAAEGIVTMAAALTVVVATGGGGGCTDTDEDEFCFLAFLGCRGMVTESESYASITMVARRKECHKN